MTSAVTFQADTVKGYRSWDEAGLIANKYSDRFQTVDNVSVRNTLRCADPRDPTDFMTELHVSPSNIWLAYRARVPWVTVRQETAPVVEWIARAISVSQFSRLGLRVTLLWEGNDRDHVLDMLLSSVLQVRQNKWTELGDAQGAELVVFLTRENLGVRVGISPVVNVRREERVTVPGIKPILPIQGEAPLPDYALSVDVDLADTRITDSVDVKPHINRSVEYIQTDFLPHIARMLAKEN